MNLNKKSRLTSFVLTIILGPLGLAYSSLAGCLILLVITIITFPTVIVPIICWVLAIAYGDHKTHRHNQSIEKFERIAGKNNQRD